MSDLRLVIAGCGGRMGRALIEAVTSTPGVVLAGALERAESPLVGQDAGLPLGLTTGVRISHDVDAALAQADALIDFTRPEATLAY
ncbi:4-hydroxy-tetrahydrodipicolinate reductase, partial [Laribacter hongkongensis]|nr:4-hydroxy-tetrahydrodipicolinate reductase [Laribacter hongkongensis]